MDQKNVKVRGILHENVCETWKFEAKVEVFTK